MVFTHRDVDPTVFTVTNGNCIFLANILCPVDPLFRADNFYLLIVLVFVLNNRLFFSKVAFYTGCLSRYSIFHFCYCICPDRYDLYPVGQFFSCINQHSSTRIRCIQQNVCLCKKFTSLPHSKTVHNWTTKGVIHVVQVIANEMAKVPIPEQFSQRSAKCNETSKAMALFQKDLKASGSGESQTPVILPALSKFLHRHGCFFQVFILRG